MSRDITPFGLRMPTELKARVDEAAAANGRSINSEILDRLSRSFDLAGAKGLTEIPDGLLLDEVISRYGARLQIIIAKDMADTAGIASPSA
jgi:hypothetical protein